MMNVGDWQVEFGGNVNGFLTHTKCDPDEAGPVDGGLACGSFGADRDVGNIRTGLLPSWFGFHATQEKNGFKQGITIGFQPGIDSNTSIAGAPIDGGLGLNSSNFRQVFLEFSGKDWGGFKVGRDLGLFGSDAILSDMTLLGVGTTATDFNDGGGNTSLGRIGVGYVYADWKGQIQYTSPDWSGFQFSLAVDDPWGLVNLSGDSLNAATFEQKGDTYGFEGKAGYTWKGTSLSGKVWAELHLSVARFSASAPCGLHPILTFDSKKQRASTSAARSTWLASKPSVTTTRVPVLARPTSCSDAVDGGGDTRDSDGYYLQASYKIPGPGTEIGVSWGQSNLDRGSNDLVNTNLVKKNESVVVGIYHPLTDALYLVGEYTQTQATSHSGNQAQEDSFAFGAILFY
jgi:predicted porin